MIENHALLKKLSRQDVSFSLKPCITSAIKVSIKQKNRLYRKQLGSNNACLILEYRRYSKLGKLTKLSKKNYYLFWLFFSRENYSNLKKKWTGIRDIFNPNPKTKNTQGIQSKIVEDNIEITDNKTIAETFNKYFFLQLLYKNCWLG